MQESLQRISLQITEYWKGIPNKKKIKLVVGSLLFIFLVVILIFSLTRTKYEVLYNNLSLKDMGQISAKLDEIGTPWKSGVDQKSIMVPKADKGRTKIELATFGLPKEGYSYDDAFSDSSWTMTDYDKKQRMKRALESELAQTIAGIDGIYSSEVYIAEIETSNFILKNDDSKITASVFIVKSDNKAFSAEKVNAIKKLVSQRISTDSQNISVIDDQGRLLGEQNDDDIFSTDQFIVKQNLESSINQSITNFLENIVGLGNVDVMSSVKINMDLEKTTIVEFSPPIKGNEEGLIRSLEEAEEHMIGGTQGGVPGTETNVEDYQMIDDSSSKYDKISRIINNELNEINKEIRRAPGQVESITVAVLINKDALLDGEFSQDREKEFTELVFAATGLDTKQVQIKAESFTKKPDSGITTQTSSINLVFIGLIALAIIVLAIIIFVFSKMKNRKPRVNELERLLEEKSSSHLDVADIDFEIEESKMKAQIDKFIEKKPDSVAQLLRNWLNE